MTVEENLKFREKIIKRQFKERVGYDLNLEDPKTFNEKIQWLKLYYHDPLMTKCADKYLVREYIKEKIGEKYLIPLLGVWDKPEDIDFDSLPNQFVLKVNWGCGQNIIVKDKSKLDIINTIEKLKYWLEPFSNHYYNSYEWAYKNIKPKIICEKYIEQIDGNLVDYKVFCFNGEAKYIQVDVDRFTDHKRCIYDLDWIKQEFKTEDSFELYYKDVNRPDNLNTIIYISKILSSQFYNARVDLYDVNRNIYFGELTFSHGNGMEVFSDIKWDYKFGELLELPKEKKIEYDILDKNSIIDQSIILEPISVKYKELEKDSVYKDKYKKLKNNFFALFGFLNEDDYFTLVIFGIKIIFKKKTRPDQTRPDQTRPEYVKSTYHSIIIQNIKNYNLCSIIECWHRFFICIDNY